MVIMVVDYQTKHGEEVNGIKNWEWAAVRIFYNSLKIVKPLLSHQEDLYKGIFQLPFRITDEGTSHVARKFTEGGARGVAAGGLSTGESWRNLEGKILPRTTELGGKAESLDESLHSRAAHTPFSTLVWSQLRMGSPLDQKVTQTQAQWREEGGQGRAGAAASHAFHLSAACLRMHVPSSLFLGLEIHLLLGGVLSFPGPRGASDLPSPSAQVCVEVTGQWGQGAGTWIDTIGKSLEPMFLLGVPDLKKWPFPLQIKTWLPHISKVDTGRTF